MSIENIIPQIIAERPKNYFLDDEYSETDPNDPLSKVVPCFTDDRDFFGSFVCNILVFTKVPGAWDEQIEETKQKLIDNFHKFARYELHLYIDLDSITSVGSFENQLIELANELSAYNVTYEGKFVQEQMKASIDNVIDAFNVIVSD